MPPLLHCMRGALPFWPFRQTLSFCTDLHACASELPTRVILDTCFSVHACALLQGVQLTVGCWRMHRWRTSAGYRPEIRSPVWIVYAFRCQRYHQLVTDSRQLSAADRFLPPAPTQLANLQRSLQWLAKGAQSSEQRCRNEQVMSVC